MDKVKRFGRKLRKAVERERLVWHAGAPVGRHAEVVAGPIRVSRVAVERR